MATATFTGDPRAPGFDPALVELHGIAFPLNEPIEVPDAIALRLSSHSHFTVTGQAERPATLKAVHKGFGRWVIQHGDDDVTLAGGLSKADAAAFNALSDADKAAYVGR